MKEKINNFKGWYLKQYNNNKVLFFLVQLFILVIIISSILK